MADESVRVEMKIASLKRWLFLCFFVPISLHAAELHVASNNLSLWELIKQGGWAMWPLGLCAVFLIFLVIYGWRETLLTRLIPQKMVKDLMLLLRQRDLAKANDLLQTADTMLSRVMSIALSKLSPSSQEISTEKVELALSEALEIEENQLAQWVQYLNVVAAVAPMIGLLGTVSGMISAFQTISFGGMGRPELLAGNIGEALITTATGLIVGIPAMVFYFVLRNRLNNGMIQTTQAISDLIDGLKAPKA